MAVDHLRARHLSDITDVEAVGILLRDGRVHQHLQQQVAELLAKRGALAAVNGIEHLVRFLEEVGPQRAVRLLAVPRAAAGRAQVLDHLVEGAQGLDGFVTHHPEGTVRRANRALGRHCWRSIALDTSSARSGLLERVTRTVAGLG